MIASHFIWLSAFKPFAVVLVYTLCAGAVTVDVLLKKGDVRSALGWIALAWLSPFFGGALYFLFGINRVTRRAVKFTRLSGGQAGVGEHVAAPSDGLATLARASERITATPLTAGNALVPLEGGKNAYPAMLAAINGATQSIALASYIFRDDKVGEAFIAALGDAHRRGVAVRVLLDSVGSGYVWSAAFRRLKAAQVPAAQFLHTWIPWRMPFLNMRNHRKILVVDGALAFLGGINIGEEYARDAGESGAVQDVHFRVEGPVVRQIMDVFARDWSFTTGEPLDAEIWWPPLGAMGGTVARGVCSGPDADIYKLEMMIGAALNQAQHHVRIVSPYFLPEQRLQFAIAQAVLRGVRVDIVVPERSDHRFLDWALRAHIRFLRYTAARFHFSPPPFDHTKLVTMDGQWCLIGSSNWDTRSFRLNFEYDLECYSTELTAALERLIDVKIARAHRSRAKDLAAPLWVLVRDAAVRLLIPYL